MKTVSQQRDQIPEHVAGAGEAMQQQQLRCAALPGFPKENLKATRYPIDV
jgi:hypothetical protein